MKTSDMNNLQHRHYGDDLFRWSRFISAQAKVGGSTSDILRRPALERTVLQGHAAATGDGAP